MRTSKKAQIKKQYEAQKAYEPQYSGETPITLSQMIETFNWYHLNKNENDAARYLKCDKSLVKKYLTLAWAARMKARGFIFPEKEKKTLEILKAQLDSESKAIKVKNQVTSSEGLYKSIQEKVELKTNEFIAELEGFVDEFGIYGSSKEMNAYQWMMENGVKPAHTSKIIQHFKNQAKEIELAVSGKDSELSEGYEEMGKLRLKNILTVIRNIIKDAEKASQNQKVARKPRAKKPVTVEKMISSLKYKERDDEYKIQSVDPSKIIGAQQIWVFNTKTRKLGRYVAKDGDGIGIKGTTLLNFSEESVEKIVRKPEEILDTVTKGGKPALKKVLDSVRAVQYNLTGRMNSDTVILRVL